MGSYELLSQIVTMMDASGNAKSADSPGCWTRLRTPAGAARAFFGPNAKLAGASALAKKKLVRRAA